ncbi:MAG: glycosyltransferase family 4 protein [Halioglobus sp.]|nr:glycosyltransferase family 4 protein [Halioglobus sp.]
MPRVRLALVIDRYFPHAALQRDCFALAEALLQRGHACVAYCRAWEGPQPAGLDVRPLPVRALREHTRRRRFEARLQRALAAEPVDAVLGFDAMPGLDVHFAGDVCHAATPDAGGAGLWRRARNAQRLQAERAVFGPDAATRVLLLSDVQCEAFRQHYATPPERLCVLPPGVDRQRRAGQDSRQRRVAARRTLGLEDGALALLFIASSFHRKGLDRAITALANMAVEQPAVQARLLVVGADEAAPFAKLARQQGVEESVEFLGPRDDVLDLMLAADLLLHPARVEAGGVVLLEAIAAGLPVVTVDSSGYAGHVAAARSGLVLVSPFTQEVFDKAVMRNIDGVFRADCRDCARSYADKTDLWSMHAAAADQLERWFGAPAQPPPG